MYFIKTVYLTYLKYIFLTFVLLSALLVIINPVLANECNTWFKSTGLKYTDKNCFVKCIAEPDEINCSDLCVSFCAVPVEKISLFSFSFYLRLNQAKVALINDYPMEMLSAYNLSWKAKSLCSSLFAVTNRDHGAYDACRHFIWSALLYKELGLDLSKRVLNAHEQDQPEGYAQEKTDMDLHNNDVGLMAAKYLLQQGQFNDKQLLLAFQVHFKQGDLTVLRTH